MTSTDWVCGIDMGSFNTLSYVAWLKDSLFVLDLYCPTTDSPLPKLTFTTAGTVKCYAFDAPQGLPKAGRKRRLCDEISQTPTRVLPTSLSELNTWPIYRGFIECGVKTFWAIYQLPDIQIFGFSDSSDLPVAAETYPRKVAEALGIKNMPSKRKEPLSYVDYVWTALKSRGYKCESVIRPAVDHVDAMLCGIAAQALIGKKGSLQSLGEKPFIDDKEAVLREGFIIIPAQAWYIE